MSRHASAADFEGGPLYDEYRRYPFFAERADAIPRLFPHARTILVAGCGWGFLVDELVARGFNAWGVDIAPYAIERAQQQLAGHARARILRGDCTKQGEMLSVRAQALSGQAPFDLIVTEDMLPVCDDEGEVSAILAALRPIGRALLHIITCADQEADRLPGLLWKTQTDWKAIVGGDLVLNAEGGRVL